MAKDRLITRTIVTTRATLLCLDVDTGEACNRYVTLPRTYKKEADIIRRAKQLFDEKEPTVIPAHVVEVEILETLYGMPESTFIANANPIEKPVKSKI